MVVDSCRIIKGVHELHRCYLCTQSQSGTESSDDKSNHVIGIGYSIHGPPDDVKHLIRRKHFCTFMAMKVNVANGGENEAFASGSFARGSTSTLSH